MRKTWRCFHCDEVFTSHKWALEHFGADCSATPACQIKGGDGHLVTHIRKLEAELASYRSEDTDLLRAIYAFEADPRQALIREEERGYARGVRDMQAQGYCADPHKHELEPAS